MGFAMSEVGSPGLSLRRFEFNPRSAQLGC